MPAAKTTTRRRRDRPSPRQRLLKAATRLFTTEGIRVIGIDRILREADVAKASLYSLFGSKDNLVIACLERLTNNGGRAGMNSLISAKNRKTRFWLFSISVLARSQGRIIGGPISRTRRANIRARKMMENGEFGKQHWSTVGGAATRWRSF